MMKPCGKFLGIASALLALPLLASAQPSEPAVNGPSIPKASLTQQTGAMEAARMVPAQATLMQNFNAKDAQSSSTLKARLSRDVTLKNGTRLAKGTLLIGQVESRDASTLAIRFTQAETKDGKTIPVKATIVGIVKPAGMNSQGYPMTAGDQAINHWNDHVLEVNQLGVVPGADLHSSIASDDSGVLVSKNLKKVKLSHGSEIEFAIAPASTTPEA